MNKNKKNSLIITIIIVVVFLLAYLGYNQLSLNAPDTSYTPTINVDAEKISSLETQSKNIVSKDSTVANSLAASLGSAPSDSAQATTSITSDDKQSTSSTTDSNTSLDQEGDVSSENSAPVATQDDEEAVNPDMMPDIPLTLLNGEETTFWQLAELGKPVVINSFASWCPPCKAEMPEFIEASEEYKGEVTFVFFDSFDGERETKEALNAFAEKYFNDDTICVIDPGYISYLFKSNSLPTTILLNKEGIPVNGFQGMVAKDTLVAAIEQLLAE